MNHTQFTQWRQGRYTMGRVFEDGSLVRHAQLRFEAACQSMLNRPLPPSRPSHVPWYTREGKTCAFTLAQLRKWKALRNSTGMIIGVDRGKPKTTRITKRQYDDTVRRLTEAQSTLRLFVAYLDGHHDDASVVERARRIAA